MKVDREPPGGQGSDFIKYQEMTSTRTIWTKTKGHPQRGWPKLFLAIFKNLKLSDPLVMARSHKKSSTFN